MSPRAPRPRPLAASASAAWIAALIVVALLGGGPWLDAPAAIAGGGHAVPCFAPDLPLPEGGAAVPTDAGLRLVAPRHAPPEKLAALPPRGTGLELLRAALPRAAATAPRVPSDPIPRHLRLCVFLC